MRAKDGSEHLLLSVYKNYIHVETLPDRSSPHLCAAYSSTHAFFCKLSHQLKVNVLDNETSESLFTYFDTQHITYQPVPPNQKRANAAERSIQTFRRHFLSLLATTHPSFPINHWPALLPQAELTLNLQRPYAEDLPSISAHNGIYREPYDFSSHPLLHAALSSSSTTPVERRGTTLASSGFTSDRHSTTIGLTIVSSRTLTVIGYVITLFYIQLPLFSPEPAESTNCSPSLSVSLALPKPTLRPIKHMLYRTTRRHEWK